MFFTVRAKALLDAIGPVSEGDVYDLDFQAETTDGRIVNSEGFIQIVAPKREK